jgi:hypothetical protein
MAHRSTVYTPENYRLRPGKAAPNITGHVIHPASGDVTTEYVSRQLVHEIGRLVWNALGYLDTIDIDQQVKVIAPLAATQQTVQSLSAEARVLRQRTGRSSRRSSGLSRSSPWRFRRGRPRRRSSTATRWAWCTRARQPRARRRILVRAGPAGPWAWRGAVDRPAGRIAGRDWLDRARTGHGGSESAGRRRLPGCGGSADTSSRPEPSWLLAAADRRFARLRGQTEAMTSRMSAVAQRASSSALARSVTTTSMSESGQTGAKSMAPTLLWSAATTTWPARRMTAAFS